MSFQPIDVNPVTLAPSTVPQQPLADEYGNVVKVAEDTLPWQMAVLDELRAIRVGMQMLVEYMNPASGNPNYVPSLVASAKISGSGSLFHNEVDLISLAQGIRDGWEQEIT